MTDLERQTWVLTGAAGAIGTELRKALAPRVGSLRLVDRVPIDDPGEREDARVVVLAELELLTAVCANADGVIHLAGIADEADFHELAESNIVGTYHALEAARRNGVSRFIYASSNRATGFYDVGERITPDLPPRPDGFYGASKVAAEALCRLYSDKFGLAVAALRIGSFESAPSEPRHLSTWLSPADCVRAFVAAMTAPDLAFANFYAVSANESGWWDLEAGKALGFEPVDRADALLKVDPSQRLRSPARQGGMYAEQAYSIDRINR
jgi:uronate dehydrogenase